MSPKTPKISVVMPAYNAEKYLDESISSILNQTFSDFEFIIIDDASRDNSKSIIKKFQRKDRRIKFLQNKRNLGVALTRNKGLKIARGEYIATFDADDISLPQRLEIQKNYLENHPSIFLIGSSAILIDEKGDKMGVFKKLDNSKKVKKKLLKSNPIINSSTMFRNKGNLFYRDKFDGADEYDLFLRLLTEGKNITNLPYFLVKYRMNPGSISFRKRSKQKYFTKKIQEMYHQRKTYGEDSYDQFYLDSTSELKENADFERIKLHSKILAEFQEGKFSQVRKEINNYFRRYGTERNLLVLKVLSFLPRSLINFFRIFV